MLQVYDDSHSIFATPSRVVFRVVPEAALGAVLALTLQVGFFYFDLSSLKYQFINQCFSPIEGKFLVCQCLGVVFLGMELFCLCRLVSKLH